MSSPSSPASDSTESFRSLTQQERELLDALLSNDFPGRGELVEQAAHAKVRQIDPEGSLSFAPSAPKAQVVRRVPVEAEVEDEDGVTVHVLLHVLEGALAELEVFREDSKQLRRPLDVQQIRVLNF